MRIEYLKSMGIKAIRLNSIFSSTHYPEQYATINSLTRISENLGTIEDFDALVDALHKNNISLILDIPSHPFTDSFRVGLGTRKKKKFLHDTLIDDLEKRMKREFNIADNALLNDNEAKLERYIASNFVDPSHADNELTSALKYWTRKKVDGFYLKSLEEYVEDSEFINHLNAWRDVVKYPNILMCNWKTYQLGSEEVRSTVLKTIDLLDATIVLSNGTKDMKQQIDEVIKNNLYSIPAKMRPWIHWSVGSIDTNRVTSTLQVRNATSAAMIMEMMLPGTGNIFYGDEVNLFFIFLYIHRFRVIEACVIFFYFFLDWNG